MRTSAIASMRWRSRFNPASRCISTSRCMSRPTASATTEPMPPSSRTAATSRIGIGCPLSAISAIASSMRAGVRRQYGLARRPAVPSLVRRRGAPDPSRRRPDQLRGDGGDERGSGRGCAGRAPPHLDGRRATLLPLRHGCTHQQSIWRVLRSLRACTKNSGILRRGQGRPSRFRSFITLGMLGIWAAWWRAYAPRSITIPGSLVPTHTAISG